MIDTHCHIHDFSTYKYVCRTKKVDSADFTPEKLVERAREKGVSKMICVGTTMEDSKRAREFSARFSDEVFWAYGVHPDESEKMLEVSFEEIEKDFLMAGKLPVAIGEIGLDFHKDHSPREVEQQVTLFRKMLKLAKKYRLPAIFHVREAFDEFFEIIDEFRGVSGVVHSFSDSEEIMQKCLERGFYIGVGGIVTFRKKAPVPPLDRILLETDAPFLTPVPYRKEVNEPHYVRATAEFLAEFLAERDGSSAEKIIALADKNANRLFGI